MNLQMWQTYATCWSAPEAERTALLATQAAEGIRYRDPLMETEGRASLSAYMAGFQQALPGHRFAIRSVEGHHGRSLARWSQVDAGGNVVADGVSCAAHDEAGRFADITGFFPVAPPAPADQPPL